MKTDRTILLQRTCMFITKGSTRGCGRRYVLIGNTPQGECMRVETNPGSESNWTCDIRKQSAIFFRVGVREVGVMSPVADWWETSASSGEDLEAEFERQKSVASNQEQDHGQ